MLYTIYIVETRTEYVMLYYWCLSNTDKRKFFFFSNFVSAWVGLFFFLRNWVIKKKMLGVFISWSRVYSVFKCAFIAFVQYALCSWTAEVHMWVTYCYNFCNLSLLASHFCCIRWSSLQRPRQICDGSSETWRLLMGLKSISLLDISPYECIHLSPYLTVQMDLSLLFLLIFLSDF